MAKKPTLADRFGKYPHPPVRRLRVYAFDPQASTRIETAGFNVATIELPWELKDVDDPLEPGPRNEYLEVIDIDPVSDQFYEPVDLNHPLLLAQDGLAPTEGDPRFHQQMVFAIAMKTIRLFERALGRKVFWSPVWREKSNSYERVERLRVYPHALREPNAYYSPQKKALLFGYFKSVAKYAGASWTFTALSHDVVAHETTHAILDGLHRRYSEQTSPDSLAFHEAFADIVALLSHFTLSEAVRNEIAVNGGKLDGPTMLSDLAKQFGAATGHLGALRSAIDPKSEGEPDATLLDRLTEPHDRGAILVAAVFDAFLTIYQRRTADLLRIAGTRIDQNVRSDLHPDLVARLTREAVKSADHIMRMCLRALDYLPPVDVRFGEFLRAIVTADSDLVPNDPYGYRLAIVEAFRRRGIVPTGCLSLAVDSLLWERPPVELGLGNLPDVDLDLDAKFKRSDSEALAEKNRETVHKWLDKPSDADASWQDVCGVIFDYAIQPDKTPLQTILRWPKTATYNPSQYPKVEVHSVRTTRRTGPDGQDIRQLIIEVTQRRRGFFDDKVQKAEDGKTRSAAQPADFIYRGGATLIFDLRDRKLRYVIRKRIDDERRLNEQREFMTESRTLGFMAMYGGEERLRAEPFAMTHRGF